MSATPKRVPRAGLRLSCCTAGPTTFTASSMWRRLLASAGYRVIVPYLRGYGTTRFLSGETVRNGQPAALASDIIDLMDALDNREGDHRRFRLGRAHRQYNRGPVARALQGDGLGQRLSDRQPGIRQDAAAAAGRTAVVVPVLLRDRARRAGYAKIPARFRELIWQLASPKWAFDDATFDRSAAAFDNPDHVAIVIHNYRWRLDLAEGEPKYDELEKRLAAFPAISVPTITMEGDANGAPHPAPSAYATTFYRQIRTPRYYRRHRAQSAAGSPAGVCAGGDRRRSRLIERASTKAPNHVGVIFA